MPTRLISRPSRVGVRLATGPKKASYVVATVIASAVVARPYGAGAQAASTARRLIGEASGGGSH